MPFFRRKKDKDKEETPPEWVIPNIKIDKSLSPVDIDKAKGELRVSSVEKEILGETLTRLYEATTEGRITTVERDRLVAKYREHLSKLDSTLDYNQKIISLYELEETRAELVKLFHDKFHDVNVKIDDIRRRLGVSPKEVMEVRLAPQSEKEAKPRAPEKPAAPPSTPPTPRRTKADDELEKLRQELQKELEKLEQIEMEA
jgi:chromosome segregation ATPase